MNVTVDSTVCEGNALCVEEVPDVFELGDDVVARVLPAEVPPERADAVRRAAVLCPKQALAIVESDHQ